MSSDYVYTMYRADKFYGPERQVLSNISLSFLPGAKIGVLGPNGAGKSTLLRIMAGLEEPSSGVAELHPGATVGPTFELFYPVDYLLPHRQAAWLVMEERLRDLADLGVRCREVCSPLFMPVLNTVTAALAAEADELAFAR